MIDADECCVDILMQISAVNGALNKVGAIVLENQVNTCVQKRAIEAVTKNSRSWLRFFRNTHGSEHNSESKIAQDRNWLSECTR